MAKATKKTTTKTTVQKKTVSANMKEEPAKKLTVEPEKKKLTAKPEAKKLTATKAPEKIAAKPEPKKIVSKEVAKLETKKADVKEEKKPVVKKVTKEVKKADVKPMEVHSAKEEAPKTVKKAPAKKSAVKKSETKPATKKASVKKDAVKETSKKTVKKAATLNKEDRYQSYSLEECMEKVQAMGVMHSYDDYKKFLLDEANIATIEKNIVDGNQLTKASFDLEKDGYDIDLIGVLLQKIADTMDIKAADFALIKKDMNASVKAKMSDDDEKNAKEYLKEFKTAEKILMIGQRKDLSEASEVTKLLGSDVDVFMDHFFTLAYDILPTWQYDDVKFYEDFAYAILSQYSDLFEKYQLRILIECADLYIKHGDFQHGDENYGYILRDNQIKDYIYYRYASIYEDIDFNKAKGIAYESLQYVDDRYTYYPNIMEILNK